MKRVLPGILAMLLFLGCSNGTGSLVSTDDKQSGRTAVQFSFSEANLLNDKATMQAVESTAISRSALGTTVDPNVRRILVSISSYWKKMTPSGTSYFTVPIHENESIEVFKFGDQYYSGSLYLDDQVSNGGNESNQLVGYQITQFLVLDGENEVIYAAPRTGSKIAYNNLGATLLDYLFTAGLGLPTVSVSVNVISTVNYSASDFGYTNLNGIAFKTVPTFDLSIVTSSLTASVNPKDQTVAAVPSLIQVTYPDGKTASYTKASGQISSGKTTFKVKDNQASYTISVQSGTTPVNQYSRVFTAAELKANPTITHTYDWYAPKFSNTLLSFSNKTTSSFTVSWNEAQNNDSVNSVTYVVGLSKTNNDSRFGTIDANGYMFAPNTWPTLGLNTDGIKFSSLLGTLTQSYTFSALSPNTTYYVVVFTCDGFGRYSRTPCQAVTTAISTN
jgi:hypothetical protein